MIHSRTKIRKFLWLVIAVTAFARPAAASIVASLAILPDPSDPTLRVLPGQTATFFVTLTEYLADDPSDPDPIVAFRLNLGDSDPLLTAGGTDFSGFTFDLNPSVGFSLPFDDDISDDGIVEFGADLPPFGTDTGLFPGDAPIVLGVLRVVAPENPGFYQVGLAVTPSDPIFGGGTFLQIDDGSLFGQTLPGDGTLNISNSGLSVVPEPGSVSIWMSVFALAFCRRRKKAASLTA